VGLRGPDSYGPLSLPHTFHRTRAIGARYTTTFVEIRRVELRTQEYDRHGKGEPTTARADGEFWEDDLPELRG